MLHIRSIDRAHIIYYSTKYDTTINGPYPMRPTHCLCLVGQKCRGRKMGMHSPHAFFICNTITSTRGSLLLPPNHMYTQCNHSRQKSLVAGAASSPFPIIVWSAYLLLVAIKCLRKLLLLPGSPTLQPPFFLLQTNCHLPLHLIPAARIHPHLEPMATRCCRGTNATDQVNTRHRCT